LTFAGRKHIVGWLGEDKDTPYAWCT